ncbi:MAG: dienelactone hydrolase family protein [Pirellulaceae bacterium]|nr:dienelactone hydrolase family protein [Pirellulaceae bacterium]
MRQLFDALCAGMGLWIAVAAVIGRAQDADVSWLEQVNRVPAEASAADLGYFAPLLVDEDGRGIDTRGDWERQRRVIRDKWQAFLGPMPDPRPAVVLEVLRTDALPDVTRQLVRYEVEPGQWGEGYLLVPDDAGDDDRKRPGIVALHPTTADTIEEIAGVRGREDSQLGLQLARRGFVVFCPRCFLWQDVASLDEAVARHRTRHPHSLGMAKMLYDAMRGVDVLATLPQVDSQRMGAVGHSLGAKETLYLAAFDERIKAAVASEGGLGFRSTNWDAPWYLGPAIQDEQFPLNHHQLLALIAPRPFLVVGGEAGPGAADGQRSWPLIAAAMPVWRLWGEPVRVGLLNHGQGHVITAETFKRIAEWLQVYL